MSMDKKLIRVDCDSFLPEELIALIVRSVEAVAPNKHLYHRE